MRAMMGSKKSIVGGADGGEAAAMAVWKDWMVRGL